MTKQITQDFVPEKPVVQDWQEAVRWVSHAIDVESGRLMDAAKYVRLPKRAARGPWPSPGSSSVTLSSITRVWLLSWTSWARV